MERVLRFKDLNLSKKAIYTEMGYGNSLPDDRVRKIVDNLFAIATNIVRPRFYVQPFYGFISDDIIVCSGVSFHVNRTIASLLKNAEMFILFAATAGREYQQVHNKLSNGDDTLTLFIWDALGSCIAEATGDIMEQNVETELPDLPHSNRFSPGYCGWPVKEQIELFSLLPPNVCGIKLNDSALMYPIKSISGIIGLGTHIDTHKYGCQFCELDTCYKKHLKNKHYNEAES